MNNSSELKSSRRTTIGTGWRSRLVLRLLCFALVAAGLPSMAIVSGQTSTPVVVFDSFTDAAGVDLEDHTGELGASWAPHPEYDSGIDISPDGTVYNGTNTKVYLASGTPPSAEYDIEADLIIRTNQDHGGIVGRANPNSDTYYAAEGSSAQDIWQLRKRVNGSWTLLDFVEMDFEPGRTYRLRLELRDGSQKFYVDDVLVLEDDDDDPALRQTGRAGIRLSSDSFHPNDPSRGWQLDNFRVTASGPADTTPPAAPANLTAETDAGGVIINLDWDDNADFDLAGYDVYRGNQPGGPYTKINASLLTSSSYVDTSAPGGATSYYQVIAVDLSDNQSAPSNEASATRPVDNTPPAAPANLTATGTFTGIDIDWDASVEPDVVGYNIYRGSQAGGPYTLIDVIGKTSSYLDSEPAPGETAYYRVSAIDSSDNESDLSGEASATRIEASYGLMVSTSPDRSNAIPLNGQTVSGNIYAFTAPDSPDIDRVQFFIDNPDMDGSPDRIENSAPYDLGGGTAGSAEPFNTNSLADGGHTLTAAIELDDGPVQIAHATFTINNAPPLPAARPVPGTIQAEDYDLGGEGVAYHDTTSGNSGGEYRDDNVDIQTTTDIGGGYNVGWIRTGEWLHYTLDIPSAGEYTVTFRLATPFSNRQLHLEIDGLDISGPVIAPNTGGSQNWADVSTTVQLPAGIHTLRVVLEGNNINFNYFTVTANEPPPAPPVAPENLTATLAADEITINLDWDDNDEPDLAGYRIYRAEQSGGPYEMLAEIGAISEYADATAPTGLTVYYQVTALNEDGDESEPSNEASATRPGDTTPPAAPAGLVATGTFDGIDLDWADNTESDLGGYRIYRSNQPGGPYSLIDETGATSSYTDDTMAAGETRYYQVTAVDTTGNESGPSAEASATRLLDTTPPAAPTGLTATGTVTGIDLDWADNGEPDLAGYRVYRSAQSGGPFTLIDEIGATSTYTDNTVAAGETAFYQVTAFDANGNESAPSAEASATRLDSAFALLVSTSPDRSNPVALDGQTVSGNIYVFTAPDTASIQQVRFFIDNPSMNGSPDHTDDSAPYDLGGGLVDAALPFNTNSLSDGAHTLTVAIDLAGGSTDVIQATFDVQNDGTDLQFGSPTLEFTASQDGNPVSQPIGLSTEDGTTASVNISDNVSWISVSPTSTTTPATLTVTVDPSGLVSGTYTGTVTATANGYSPASLLVVLSIGGAGPDQVHLSWASDPSTTLTVVWRTVDSAVPSVVEYRRVGDTTWQSATGTVRPSGTTGVLHEVTLASLTPSTAYEYRVQGPNGAWSQVFEARTAPSPGPADFDFIYVADTGLIGRTDGLTSGTRQVIEEIANLDPLLVLGGGDYAYFDTDKRFGTLDNTIDAWFNQMQPVAAYAPLMPTYGNHEELLDENSETWAARFATPAGFDAHRNYSFDVGDVHFVSIFSVQENDPLPSATVEWIRQDILDAKARGQRWIIPYFHVSPFSEGQNHPSNIALREQLGPLFESLGVQVVIASHDQSYERTYPLVDVPATNTPTSNSLVCYTMEDGVTWVKVSPGGKLSNLSGDFSPWDSPTPSDWTAFRDNTMHHFLRVRVSGSGTLEVEAYGVAGDGSPPVIQDHFQYTTGECEPPDTTPPAPPTGLTASSTENGIVLDWADNSEPDLAGYYVYRSSSETGPFVRISSGIVTGSTFTDDDAPFGTSFYYVTAVNTENGESDPSGVVSAERDDSSPYSIVFSTVPNRANPLPLEGQIVSGDIYIFTTPDTSDIQRVRFFLDDPTMSGSPYHTENSAPYDLEGGTVGSASPFDADDLADGPHTLTAAIDRTSGSTVVIHASFNVNNALPPPAAPSNLTAELAADEVTINLDWDDNTEVNLAGYRIYRSEQSGGPYTLLAEIGPTSSYADNAAPAGITVYYQVTAFDTGGGESGPSNEASAIRPVDTTPPAAPTGLTATGAFTGIDLDWDDNGEPDLAGYRIYRSDQADGTYTLLDEVGTGSAYTDDTVAAGETAYYRVTAVDTVGNESDPSSVAGGTRLESGFTILVSTNANRSNPVALNGHTVASNVYIFTAPETPNIQRVRFYLDDPDMDGSPYRTENSAPYDLGGGSVDAAEPFSTTTLGNGAHTLTAAIEISGGGVEVVQAEFTVDNAVPPPTAIQVPGTIQAEDYDAGGSGVGYFDTTSGNSGGEYRSDNVDIQETTDVGGGYNVGWIRTGEWLRYTLDIPEAGAYTFTFRVATPLNNRRLHVELDGVDISGTVVLPNTGGTQNWTNVSVTVFLPAGVHPITIVMDSDQFNFNYFTVAQDG